MMNKRPEQPNCQYQELEVMVELIGLATIIKGDKILSRIKIKVSEDDKKEKYFLVAPLLIILSS